MKSLILGLLLLVFSSVAHPASIGSYMELEHFKFHPLYPYPMDSCTDPDDSMEEFSDSEFYACAIFTLDAAGEFWYLAFWENDDELFMVQELNKMRVGDKTFEQVAIDEPF